jgi:hypothetical protein
MGNQSSAGHGFRAWHAGAFLQKYYPEGTAEEFFAHNSHNVDITAFGRMGLIGLALWLSAGTWQRIASALGFRN